jgi:hypothetical protein
VAAAKLTGSDKAKYGQKHSEQPQKVFPLSAKARLFFIVLKNISS